MLKGGGTNVQEEESSGRANGSNWAFLNILRIVPTLFQVIITFSPAQEILGQLEQEELKKQKTLFMTDLKTVRRP